MERATRARTPSVLTTYALASFGLVALGHVLSSHQAGVAALLRALGGTQIVFLVPGVLFVAPLSRLLSVCRGQSRRGGDDPQEAPGFGATDFAVYAGLINLLGHTLWHKVIVLSGHTVGTASYLAGLFVLTLIGIAALWWCSRDAAIRCAQPSLLPGLVAVGVCVVGLVVATTPPVIADENNYWPDSYYRLFALLPHRHDPGLAAGIKTEYGPEWRAVDETKRNLWGRRGAITFHNTSQRTRSVTPKWAVQNRGDRALGAVVTVNGKVLPARKLFPEIALGEIADPDGCALIHPRFDHTRHGRDKSPNLTVLSPLLVLSPGRTVVTIAIHPAAPQWSPPAVALSLYDLTNTSAPECYRRLQKHFFFGDTGDIFETLDFSRSYFSRPLQYSHCYSGLTEQPGGGYCSISDEPPLHHFLCMVALAVMGDTIASISSLFLAEVLLILLVVLCLATHGTGAVDLWTLVPLAGVGCAYCSLVRFGVESNAPDTLYALFLLLAVRYSLLKRTRLFTVFIGLAYLTHVPAPQALVMLALTHVLVKRDWNVLRAAAVAAIVMGGITLFRFVEIGLVSDWQAAFYTGQGKFLTGGRRLATIKRVLMQMDFSLLPSLWPSAKEYTFAVVAAACFLPFAAIQRKDRDCWMLLVFGLLYHAGMCLLDEKRAHHIGPPVLAFAAAGLRGLSLAPSPRWLWRTAGVAGACLGVALCLRWGPDFTGTFSKHPLRLMTNPTELGNPCESLPLPHEPSGGSP